MVKNIALSSVDPEEGVIGNIIFLLVILYNEGITKN